MYKKSVIPIIYRCDEKYKFFLINSITSVLKYYKGNQDLHFYISTNDDLDLSQLDDFKKQYTFEYSIININRDFLNQHDALKTKEHIALKKFLNPQFDELKDNNYNNSTYRFNPFSRSKTIIATGIYFLATTHHNRIVALDTDTLVISDITDLYNIDISNVVCSSCVDWGGHPTNFNPSVSVWNIEKFKEIFYMPNGILDKMENLYKHLTADSQPYCEQIQKILNDVIGSDILYIDKSWNVPITHMHLYPEPKIYHFSESWTGNKIVLDAYNSIVSKYL